MEGKWLSPFGGGNLVENQPWKGLVKSARPYNHRRSRQHLILLASRPFQHHKLRICVLVNQLTGIVFPESERELTLSVIGILRYIVRNSNSLPTSGSLHPKLKKGPRSIGQSPSLPAGWEEDVSPEGQLVYSKLIDSRGYHIRVNTDFPLRPTENHSAITQAIEKLSNLTKHCEELQSDAAFKPGVIEACLLVPEHPKTREEFGYYLVDHQDRTVFWLEEIDLEEMGLRAHDADVLRLKLEALYWWHVTNFPCRCSLSPKVWEQLGPLLIFGAVDKEFSDDSTEVRDVATLSRLEGFWRKAKDQRDADCNKAVCNWICARLWYDIIAPRAHNYWGTDYARIERTTELTDDEKPSENAGPVWIQWLCTFFLWNETAVTLKLLDEAWPGGVIYPKPWQSTMEEFSNEWEKILVLSAIMFAGAMAFLAVPVPSVSGSDNSPNDSNQGDDNSASNSIPSIIASIGSLCGILCCVFSVASMVAAVNLKRDYGGKIKGDVHEVVSITILFFAVDLLSNTRGDKRKYLQSINNGYLGYLRWSICVSLPRALFQWAVVSFCFGVVILAYQLHQDRFNFFYAEVSISATLALGIVAVRGVSPDRIRTHWLRRALKFVGKDIVRAGKDILKRSRQVRKNKWQRAPTLDPRVQPASEGSGSGTPAASST